VIRAYFAELLFRNDYSELSGLISGERKPDESARPKVFAVTGLNQLGGMTI